MHYDLKLLSSSIGLCCSPVSCTVCTGLGSYGLSISLLNCYLSLTEAADNSEYLCLIYVSDYDLKVYAAHLADGMVIITFPCFSCACATDVTFCELTISFSHCRDSSVEYIQWFLPWTGQVSVTLDLYT